MKNINIETQNPGMKNTSKLAFFSGVHFFLKNPKVQKLETDTMESNSEESNSMVAISSQRLEKVTSTAISKLTTVRIS